MKKIIKLGVIVNKCLICNVDFNPFVDFGSMPIANAFSSKEELQNEYTFDMKVGFCENCNMVQLVEQPNREKMFHENYAFFSSTSNFSTSILVKSSLVKSLSIS